MRKRFSSVIVFTRLFVGLVIVAAVITPTAYAVSSSIAEPEQGSFTSNAQAVTNDTTASNNGHARFGSTAPTGKKCLLWLHGKSGDANQSADSGNFTVAAPRGNATGWGGWQWLYFPDSGYQQVKTILSDAITSNACGQVIIHGFSNGAGAVGKLYCKGDTFGGKVIGFIIDDPVTDHAVEGCLRPAGIKVAIYWTGGLNGMGPGSDCVSADWTCEGNSVIGIDAYAQAVGMTYKQSVQTSHAPYGNPPELSQWW